MIKKYMVISGDEIVDYNSDFEGMISLIFTLEELRNKIEIIKKNPNGVYGITERLNTVFVISNCSEDYYKMNTDIYSFDNHKYHVEEIFTSFPSFNYTLIDFAEKINKINLGVDDSSTPVVSDNEINLSVYEKLKMSGEIYNFCNDWSMAMAIASKYGINIRWRLVPGHTDVSGFDIYSEVQQEIGFSYKIDEANPIRIVYEVFLMIRIS